MPKDPEEEPTAASELLPELKPGGRLPTWAPLLVGLALLVGLYFKSQPKNPGPWRSAHEWTLEVRRTEHSILKLVYEARMGQDVSKELLSAKGELRNAVREWKARVEGTQLGGRSEVAAGIAESDGKLDYEEEQLDAFLREIVGFRELTAHLPLTLAEVKKDFSAAAQQDASEGPRRIDPRKVLALVDIGERLLPKNAAVDKTVLALEENSIAHSCERVAAALQTAYDGGSIQASFWRIVLHALVGLLLLAEVLVSLRARRNLDFAKGVFETAKNELSVANVLLASKRREMDAKSVICQNAEENTRLARVDSAAARKAKDDFQAYVGRRLFEPMAALTSSLRRLKPRKLSESQSQKLILEVRRDGEDAMDSLADLIDLDQIRSDKFSLRRRSASLAEVMESAELSIATRVRAKALEFEIVYLDRVPEIIETDPDRLRRVLKNLLDHAVSSTDSGRIEIVVERRSRVDDAMDLQFTVRDTGFGMIKGRVESLFAPQPENGALEPSRYDVAAPGLSIARTLVHHMGGELAVESEVGEGTTVTFTINAGAAQGEVRFPMQLRAVEMSDTDIIRPNPLAGFRVLLAEDGVDNQRLVQFLLKSVPLEPQLAENGQLAVEAVIEAERAGRPFDLVLMDMSMPVMDGYDATRSLRELGFRGKVLALTAHALPENREECLAAGCDEFLAKPIDRSRFLPTIAALLGVGSEPESTDSSSGGSLEQAENAPAAQAPPQAQARPAQNASAGDVATGTARESTELSGTPALDVGSGPLISEFSDEEDMIELIEWFVKDLHRDVLAVERARHEGDFDRLAVVAHQLKGSAGSYGFPLLTKQANRLEAALRSGAERTEIDGELEAFIGLCKRII